MMAADSGVHHVSRLTAARARGRNGGKPQTALDDARLLMAKKMSKSKGVSVGEICDMLKISKPT